MFASAPAPAPSATPTETPTYASAAAASKPKLAGTTDDDENMTDVSEAEASDAGKPKHKKRFVETFSCTMCQLCHMNVPYHSSTYTFDLYLSQR